VIGIDAATGGQKFSVPLPEGGTSGSTIVYGITIAGDGYAYVPFSYSEPGSDSGHEFDHLRLMRVDSAGVSSSITIWDGEGPVTDVFSSGGNVITNADTGVLLTFTDSTNTHRIAITTGEGASLGSGPSIPDQYGDVEPVLQAQDGSFVGTAWVGDDVIPYMVAFDQTGIVRWSVPNEEPQIATDDGGVIAKSGIAYDQNGIAMGQIGNQPTYSWTGNAYQVGSVEQVVTNWISLAVSFWPFAGGNASGNRTANMPATKAVQELIAQTASGYVNSPNWEYKPGNQCNAFVKQVLDDAGTQAPLSLGTRFRNSFPRIAHYFTSSTAIYPSSAGDWAFPHTTMKCWQNVTIPSDRLGGYPADVSNPGDVIGEAINYTDASGHVGIIVGPQQTVSADAAALCISQGTIPAEIIDVTNYGFRLDGWASPQTYPSGVPCSQNGWKSKAVVKRFVCQ